MDPQQQQVSPRYVRRHASQVDRVAFDRYFETLSYLPPLTNDQISKQVDYMVGNGWTPCLEFAEPDFAYVESRETIRFGAVSSVRPPFLCGRQESMFVRACVELHR